MGKHFIDSPTQIVEDALHGLVAVAPNLARLDGTNVIVRADWDKTRDGTTNVALISGGGSGHEPAHPGLIGKGLLTAAVCGDVFASPSSAAVLRAIKAVTGEAGVLLIVTNYTGDRLNFGLAAEQARAQGFRVEMVIVADDIALGSDRSFARGIAGTAWVHKCAGHAAENGADLPTVTATAQETADALVSLSAALGTCDLYGQPHNTRLDGDAEYELGLGIHGEPGAAKLPMQPAAAVVSHIVERLLSSMASSADRSVALLVNNLGSVPQLEMALVSGRAVDALRAKGVVVELCTMGTLVTSLNMNGISLTLLPLTDMRREALVSSTDAIGWLPVVRPPPQRVVLPCVEEHKQSAGPTQVLSEHSRQRLVKAMEALLARQEELNDLDRELGDGDTGTSFAKGATRVIEDCKSYPAQPAALCTALAESIGNAMGGSSGVLLSIALTAAAHALAGVPQDAALDKVFIEGLKSGAAAMMKYGGAQKGSRTMIDALLPASEASDMASAAAAAQEGAESTRGMVRATHGRTAYIQHDVHAPDPGAVAVATLLQALAQA